MRTPWRWLSDYAKKSAGSDWSTLERYLAWSWGGGPASSGILVNPTTAMQSMAVYACVKVLSEGVGMLPCHLQRKDSKGGRTNATDHPLYSLLHDQPNDYQTAPEFWETVCAHMNLRGNAYAYVIRTQRGDVVELLPQNPDAVRVEMLSNYSLVYHVTLANGQTLDVGMGDMVHFRGLTLNGWLGISPIAYARESIGLALATERFGSLLFKNGAKMGGVLEHPGKLSDEAYKRVKETFDTATAGDNAHKTALLEEGMKFSKISMSNDDAQFLETRRFQRAEICSLFRVPPHLVADLDKATFSNIEQQALEFATFSLMPWLVRLEKTVKRDLLRLGEQKNMALKFNTAALMRGDAKSRADYYASGILNGWLTRNEVREAETEIGQALNPLEGLDEPLQPLNMIGVNEPKPVPAPAPAPGAAIPGEPGSGGTPQPAAATDGKASGLADSIAALAMAVARAPAPYVHVEPARVDMAGATIHHAARPMPRLDFLFDAEGNVTGAQPVTEE